MDLLSIASGVSTGVGLVAFAICAALFAYRYRLKNRLRTIVDAPPEQKIAIVQATAQDFGIDLSGLTKAQQTSIVVGIINTRRLFALLGFLISILISAVAIAYIIYNPVRVVTENVGPVSLRPGETRAVQINHQSSGAVDVEITNITADWAGLDEKRKEWTKKGRGNTPEVWFSVCSARESNECLATGAQRGINGTFRKVLPIGPASVTFVNFRDNPPIVLSARISY